MDIIKRYKYDSGLSFSKPLDRELRTIDDRVQKLNKAGMIIIDGGVGEGKTTLAVHMADYIQGKPISFEDQIAMGGNDFLTKLKICYEKKLKVLIYDEAGDFNSRGAISKFNAILNRVFETYRAFKIVVILCLPSFNVIDKTIFDKGIVRFLAHCSNRNMNNGNYAIYTLWRMFYLLAKQKKLTVKTDSYKYTVPNFYGHFLDLDPVRSKALDLFSTKNKLDILGELSNESNKDLLTFKDIAKLTGGSVVWVQGLVKKLNIVPKDVKNKSYYFDKKILDDVDKYIRENNINFRVKKND